MAGEEMPIFTRTFDLLTWLLPVSNHFPRAHRNTFSWRMLDAAFDVRERLEEAGGAELGGDAEAPGRASEVVFALVGADAEGERGRDRVLHGG